jgi:cation transport ATPase
VNDAPALGGADVGVAIGAELNEVALGGADVALLGTDLARLPQLIELADLTRRIIGQNVWIAFGLSVLLIALAASGVLAPLSGALAQSAAVFAVVANSARILRFDRPRPRVDGANRGAQQLLTSVTLGADPMEGAHDAVVR